MSINKIQFQHGMSMLEFMDRYGSEEQCIQALFKQRWPGGFRCPRCAGDHSYRVATAGRPLFQCRPAATRLR